MGWLRENVIRISTYRRFIIFRAVYFYTAVNKKISIKEKDYGPYILQTLFG